jgi:hypothetical protein
MMWVNPALQRSLSRRRTAERRGCNGFARARSLSPFDSHVAHVLGSRLSAAAPNSSRSFPKGSSVASRAPGR